MNTDEYRRQNQLLFNIENSVNNSDLVYENVYNLLPEHYPDEFTILNGDISKDPKLALAFQLASQDLKTPNIKSDSHGVNTNNNTKGHQITSGKTNGKISSNCNNTNKDVNIFNRLSKPKNPKTITVKSSENHYNETNEVQIKILNEICSHSNKNAKNENKDNLLGQSSAKHPHQKDKRVVSKIGVSSVETSTNDTRNVDFVPLFTTLYGLNELLQALKTLWAYHIDSLGGTQKFVDEEACDKSVRLKRSEASKKRITMSVFMIRTIVLRMNKTSSALVPQPLTHAQSVDQLNKVAAVIRQCTAQISPLNSLLRDLDYSTSSIGSSVPIPMLNIVNILAEINNGMKKNLHDNLVNNQEFIEYLNDATNFIKSTRDYEENTKFTKVNIIKRIEENLKDENKLSQGKSLVLNTNEKKKKKKIEPRKTCLYQPMSNRPIVSDYKQQIVKKKSKKKPFKKLVVKKPSSPRMKFHEKTLSFQKKINTDQLTNRNWDGNTMCETRMKSKVAVSNRLGTNGRSAKHLDSSINSRKLGQSTVTSMLPLHHQYDIAGEMPPRMCSQRSPQQNIHSPRFQLSPTQYHQAQHDTRHVKPHDKPHDILHDTPNHQTSRHTLQSPQNIVYSHNCEESYVADDHHNDLDTERTYDSSLNIGNETAFSWLEKINRFENYKNNIIVENNYENYINNSDVDETIMSEMENINISDNDINIHNEKNNVLLQAPIDDALNILNKSYEHKDTKTEISSPKTVITNNELFKCPDELRLRILKLRKENIKRSKHLPSPELVERLTDTIVTGMICEISEEIQQFTGNLVDTMCDNEFKQ